MASVYKIFRVEEFRAFEASGSFSGSADDLRDGFIHLSFEDQLAGTIARHFAAEAEIVIAEFDAQALGAALQLEPSRGGALFPHLYGALSKAALLCAAIAQPGRDLPRAPAPT